MPLVISGNAQKVQMISGVPRIVLQNFLLCCERAIIESN